MHMVRTFEEAGAGAVHLEDQLLPKKCGHLNGKHLVDPNDMAAKVAAAAKARRDLAVARVLADVVRANHTGPAERRIEDFRIARKPEIGERLARSIREGIKPVSLATRVAHIVEEGAYLVPMSSVARSVTIWTICSKSTLPDIDLTMLSSA